MITLLIPYFGSFPPYFQLYLDSLRGNHNLTVILITDIDLTQFQAPPNLIEVKMTLDQLRVRIQQFLVQTYGKTSEALITTPYKLVDFKIMYPLLFEDLYGPTDHVGWGDIDVIYGNLDAFITDCDIIGGYHGHFTAVRNIRSLKSLFLTVPNLYDLCIDTRTHITDEIAFRQPLLQAIKTHGYTMCPLNTSFCDIVPPCFFGQFRPDFALYTKNFFNVAKSHKNISYVYRDPTGLTTFYEDGEIQPTSYVHLQKRKMNTVISDTYYITETEFTLSVEKPRIRIHLPAIPYTITSDEFSHDAFTGKVKRFSRMLHKYEVFHYGVEGSDSGGVHIDLMTKAEWLDLRIQSLMVLDKSTREAAEAKLADPKTFVGVLANYGTPLFIEFNKRLKTHLQKNYRHPSTDIVCIPLGHSYDAALLPHYTVIETGIGYNNSNKNYRIFESYSWLSKTLGEEKKWPSNYWFVIPHSFDSTEFSDTYQPLPRPRVGFLGRIVKEKGCAIIAEVAKRFPHVDFVLCGQGNPSPYLTSSNISYKPPIHGLERSEYLGSCVATMCPTTYLEPFGCSAVESQLCGTPVITVDNGAYVETVEQFKTGLRCHTLADFCRGIQMALDSKFDRKYVRERAVRLYDMHNVAPQYDYVFESVLDIHRPSKNGWYSPDCHLSSTLCGLD
jgi:glycosyltransferase involved in cell wall biosynthesis